MENKTPKITETKSYQLQRETEDLAMALQPAITEYLKKANEWIDEACGLDEGTSTTAMKTPFDLTTVLTHLLRLTNGIATDWEGNEDGSQLYITTYGGTEYTLTCRVDED